MDHLLLNFGLNWGNVTASVLPLRARAISPPGLNIGLNLLIAINPCGADGGEVP